MELGIRFGRGVDQGTRQSMEDRTIAVADLFSGPAKVPGDHTPPPYSSKAKSPPLCGDDDEPRAAAFFGVYDGHNGVEVADILQKGLHKSLASQVCFPKDIPAALEAACKEIDEQCIELDSKRMQALIQEGTYCCGEESEESTACHLTRGGGAMSFSGAAAAMVVIYRSEEDTAGHVVLYAANVGDCRVVLCRRGEAIDLTMDHTPKREDEARRIVAAGGFVSRQRLNGILGISRAFGDIAYKAKHPGPGGLEGDIWDNQLISRPEVRAR
jgi:serine/threonine protein phosphatase PrpC